MKYLIMSLVLVFAACSSKDQASDAMEEQAGESMAMDEQIHGEEVTYRADSTDLKGYLAYDSSIEGKRPGILVVHEWWGHNDYVRKRADMLAELGYTALALDMYGDGKQAEHPDDAGKFAMAVMQNIETGEKRFNAALELLKSQETVNPEHIAAIGYCFGGGVVLHMARIGTDIDGVVSFHGSLASLHKPEPGTVKAKILVCHGEADAFATQEQVDAFKQELDDAGADYTFITYPDAKHSFTSPEADAKAAEFNIPVGYNKAADEKSWQDMRNFFNDLWSQNSMK